MPGKPDPARGPLIRDWEAAFGSPPPPFLSVRFMIRALAHDAQCRAMGGLPARTRRQLRRIAEGDGRPIATTAAPSLQAGAHLVREWNGRTHQVEVLSDGYRLDGRTWASLSAVSRHITVTNWSGPRFFGLAGRRKA